VGRDLKKRGGKCFFHLGAVVEKGESSPSSFALAFLVVHGKWKGRRGRRATHPLRRCGLKRDEGTCWAGVLSRWGGGG